jgi:hypothetical protein
VNSSPVKGQEVYEYALSFHNPITGQFSYRALAFYKMYARRGTDKMGASYVGENFLKEAYRSADLYRQNLDANGCFIPKNFSEQCDMKYSYTESMAIHYFLTGDARFLDIIPVITAAQDREAGANITIGTFTERDFGFHWMAFTHAYQARGDTGNLNRMTKMANTLIAHQDRPPGDAYPPDGSWRHGTTANVWMSSLIVDAAFWYYLLTGDNRIPVLMGKWADFLRVNGIVPGGNPWRMYEWASSIVAGQTQGSDEAHNMEHSFMLAQGYWAEDRADTLNIPFIRLLFADMPSSGTNPPRMFNWALRSSSWTLLYLDPATALPADIRSTALEQTPRGTVQASAEGLGLVVSPNPFASAVSFELPAPSGVEGRAVSKGKIQDLCIYSTTGKCVARLAAHRSPLLSPGTPPAVPPAFISSGWKRRERPWCVGSS